MATTILIMMLKDNSLIVYERAFVLTMHTSRRLEATKSALRYFYFTTLATAHNKVQHKVAFRAFTTRDGCRGVCTYPYLCGV